MNKISISIKDILLNSIAASTFTPPPYIRKGIYHLYGNKVKGVIHPGAFLGYGQGKLFVGTKSSVNYKCFFDLGADITIGNDVEIGFRVTFVNSSHQVGSIGHRAGKGFAKPIVIEDGCWIGANVTILPGVTIGKGCIIGAGTLVTKDCEPNGLYVGTPAKRIRNIE